MDAASELLSPAVPEATRSFRLYVFRDRAVTRELVNAAVQHGYEAIAVTADRPVLGVREPRAGDLNRSFVTPAPWAVAPR